MKTFVYALLASLTATAASAQPYHVPNYGDRYGSILDEPEDLPAWRPRPSFVQPHDAIAAVRSMRLTPTSAPLLARGTYVVHAVDARGTPLRVFVDARLGGVVAVRPSYGPMHYGWREPYPHPPRYGMAPPEPYDQPAPEINPPLIRQPVVAPQARPAPRPRTTAVTPQRTPVPKPRPSAAPVTAKVEPAPAPPPAPAAKPAAPELKPDAPVFPPVMPLDGP